MSIIEKAFEKAGRKSDSQQEYEFSAPIDDRQEDEKFINEMAISRFSIKQR